MNRKSRFNLNQFDEIILKRIFMYLPLEKLVEFRFVSIT